MEEKIKRLPKWAQDHIQWLNSKVTNLKREKEEMIPSGENSNIFIQDHSCIDIPLPKNSHMLFVINGMKVRIGIRTDRHEREYLNVNVDGDLIFRPGANNNGDIYCEKDF